MASLISLLSLLSIFLFFNLSPANASADIVFEEGYTVSTVLDGHKFHLNPQLVLPQPRSSDFVVLDSVRSAFYTVSLPAYQESDIKRLSGSVDGFTDGDLASAKFSRPKSFAVDLSGNVYVADKKNHAIRKISESGVTTIAGGYSQQPGHVDGPGRSASFSDDFDLAFIPEKCALLISDHGNQLVRQINLKPENCARGSQTALGTTSAWIIGLGLSCLLGLALGILLRPYIIRHDNSSPFHHSETWKHYPFNLGRQILMLCFDIRSAAVNSTSYKLLGRLILLSLSHISLMLRVNTIKTQTLHEKSVSLLDSGYLVSSKGMKPQILADQLKDLITWDGNVELSNATDSSVEQRHDDEERHEVFSCGHQGIDDMIQANIKALSKQTNEIPSEPATMSNTGLVKRR